MKRNKSSIIFLSAIIAPLSLSLLGLGTGAIVTFATYNINEGSYFTYTENGNTFNCFAIDGEANKIAIAWGGAPTDTPTNLSVPQTVTHGNDEFTVAAVARAGFRYCDFETITLPNTIEEIREEAFAYCENMIRFTLPYPVTEIAPSTFIDCRSMVKFFYYNADGSDTLLTNDRVTSIGDHAFDSCVSLTDFNCSTVLTSFGESCFQKCESLTTFYFPSKTGTGNNVNLITVESYAFADCINLAWIYFEENMNSIKPYAFVDCNASAKIHFGYYSSPFNPDTKYDTNWRKKYMYSNDSNVIEIESDHIVILQSKEYPGLRYTIETKAIKLDCQNQNSENDNTKSITLYAGGVGNEYAAIYRWDPPTEPVANYYNPNTKALIIPGSVTHDGREYPLKVIKKETFANKGAYINSVKFSDGLVQICRKAFYKCTNITSLDFSECTTLLEISNGIFSDRDSESTTMQGVYTLSLPNSLQYLGKYAFFNFYNLTNLSFKANDSNEPSHLKVIGGYAFSNIGSNYAEATIDIDLPCSLSDAAAIEANINKQESSNYNTCNWAAVGPYAFGSRTGNANSVIGQRTAVRVVKMDDPTPAQLADNTYTCSISSNAFNRSWFMTKFVASKNFCVIGCDAFKNCQELREIFLTTQKATAFVSRTGHQYPWGAEKTTDSTQVGVNPETSILGASATVKKDLVIYVDGSAPGKIDDLSTNFGQVNGVDAYKWNSDTGAATKSYHDYFGLDNKLPRTGIPTFYNVDFDKTIYYKPEKSNEAAGFLDSEHHPAYISEYNQGLIVFVKQNNKYTVSKYYCDSNHKPKNNEVNLTGIVYDNETPQDSSDDINVSADLTTIGMCSFGVASGASQVPGLYFKLPDTITKIEERAFFRHNGDNGETEANSNGVRVVTYVSGNTVQTPNGVTYSTSLNPGYCMLPNGLTDIGLDAFYNNNFSSVTLGANIARLGAGAFSTTAKFTKSGSVYYPTVARSNLATVTMTANDDFETVNNGIYYIGDANKKTLLYQAQGATGDLTIASGTKAIGMHAFAGTKYTTVTLNDDLTHIYGGAFQNNTTITTINVGANSKIKYISAMAPGDEIYDDSLPFDNIDYPYRLNSGIRDRQSRTSAFQACRALTTMNFKNMTKLVKIGSSAFRDCNNLQEMTGGVDYSYYVYDGTNETQLGETTHSGVLDLSGCSNLNAIHIGAFVGCSKVKFLHLPYTNGSIYVGVTNEGTGSDMAVVSGNTIISDNSSTRVLVGDKINKAGRGFDTSFSNANSHYSNTAFGTQANLNSQNANRNRVYYYTESINDIIGAGASGLTSGDQKANYWTIRDGKYILIEGTYTETVGNSTYTYSNAKKYWEAHQS